MAFEILYTSESIRRAIRDVLAKGSGRRVAIAAFVGNGAEAYLPSPRGLELYCWPAVPGTNPVAIRKLARKLGVLVHFAPKLHMKLYWSSKRGAVITSANLSSNAYGHGDLKEFGIRIPRGEVDINRVITSINATEMTSVTLARFEVAYREERARRRPVRETERDRVSFADWYTDRKREAWTLAPYDEYPVKESKRLREAASLQRGQHFEFCMAAASSAEAGVDDYLLCVEYPYTGNFDVSWMFVSDAAKTAKTDPAYDRKYPFQIGQAHPLRMYRRPPFDIDARFRRAIRAAATEFTGHGVANEFDLERMRKPSKYLLKALYTYYLKEVGGARPQQQGPVR